MAAASPTKKRISVLPDRYRAFIDGDLSVEDLDMEELLKGQIRDKNGQFTGRPPNAIPRSFHVRLTQEALHRAEAKWRENMDDAMGVFIDIMKNERVRAQDRLYAAQYVFERIAGKIPEKQVIEASIKKWEDVAEAVFVEVVDDSFEDAEIVEPVYGVSFDDDEEPALAIEAAPAKPVAPKSPRRPTRPKKGSVT